MRKKYSQIGCCGLDCGLCPRYYTEGDSRCPGCGGVDFELKHPPCGFHTCCVKKHELEACGECPEFPCVRFDKITGEVDSFNTYRNIWQTLRFIQKNGASAYADLQSKRIAFLEEMLDKYDDGRSKSFYCLACTLLSIRSLESALEGMLPGEDRKAAAKKLRERLEQAAVRENVELKLRH
jgi:hypothetical protein